MKRVQKGIHDLLHHRSRLVLPIVTQPAERQGGTAARLRVSAPQLSQKGRHLLGGRLLLLQGAGPHLLVLPGPLSPAGERFPSGPLGAPTLNLTESPHDGIALLLIAVWNSLARGFTADGSSISPRASAAISRTRA